MTKECALLSTAILSLSFPETVKDACGDEIYRQGCDLFHKTSAVEAGLAVGEAGRQTKSVSAMHDVTEGGVIGALYELAHASNCGLIIDEERIPVGVAQQQICDHFGIDPKYCIGAGAMIITAKADKCDSVLSQLNERDINASVIGKIVDRDQRLIIQNGNEQTQLREPGTDPYWNAFFTAFNKGWK
jgi:hydrogenase maturation factor